MARFAASVDAAAFCHMKKERHTHYYLDLRYSEIWNCVCCEALARQRYNIFGNLLVEPKEISTSSV
jgi:hypothetical protein